MAQWDAFISYARSASTLEAQRLQTAIQTFAKPWYRLRAVRIFRDDSSLSANPALWSSIEQGLQQARWLVVLLSRAAAGSEYVAAEIVWWLRHKDASTILLVHDDGTLGWDRQRGDFSAETDCVPAPLRGAFREEPRWTDLSWFDAQSSSGAADPRFQEKVADLAATIRGIARDELLGDDVAQHKRSWRLAKTAIGALSLLLIASVVASIIAIAQRNEVQRQATALLARQLAATSDSLLSRDLRRAQLLAVQAYRTDANPDTHAALLRATLASPALRRFVPFPAEISAIEASASGRFVAIGLVSGEVYSWDVATAGPVPRLRLAAAVSAVGISDDGQVLAAVDGTSALAARGEAVNSLTLPPGQAPQLVAVSPSGGGIVVASKGDAPQVTLVDLQKLNQRTLADPTDPEGYGALFLQFIDDGTVQLEGSGNETRTFPGFARLARGSYFYGARQVPGRLSADGRYATATNGAAEIPVWSVTGSQDESDRYAYLPMSNETASALNHDASRIAVADAIGIHIAQVRGTADPAGFGHSTEPPTTLVGITEVNDRGVLFLGATSRLVAASGSDLSLWDPDAAGRSATTATTAIPAGCTACDVPRVALSPDGTAMAIRDGFRDRVIIASVPGRAGVPATIYQPSEAIGDLAAPVWLDDGTVLVVASGSPDGTLTGPLPGLPAGTIGWAIGRPESEIIGMRVAQDTAAALVVTDDGRIGRYETRTGALLGEVTVPAGELGFAEASIDDALANVALISGDAERLTVVDAATGVQRFEVAENGQFVTRSLLAHGSLWVRYRLGTIERRDPASGALQRTLPGRFSVTVSGRLSAADELVAIPTDVGTSLYDAEADALLGAVATPPGWQSVKRGVAVAGDGSVLVAAFEASGESQASGLVVSTVLDPEALVATACRTSGGSLTEGDWTTLVGPDVPAELTCR